MEHLKVLFFKTNEEIYNVEIMDFQNLEIKSSNNLESKKLQQDFSNTQLDCLSNYNENENENEKLVKKLKMTTELTLKLNDIDDCKKILTETLSTCRSIGANDYLIDSYNRLKSKFGDAIHTKNNLTLLAAAYADVKDYKNAKQTVEFAWNLYNGNIPYEMKEIYDDIMGHECGGNDESL